MSDTGRLGLVLLEASKERSNSGRRGLKLFSHRLELSFELLLKSSHFRSTHSSMHLETLFKQGDLRFKSSLKLLTKRDVSRRFGEVGIVQEGRRVKRRSSIHRSINDSLKHQSERRARSLLFRSDLLNFTILVLNH